MAQIDRADVLIVGAGAAGGVAARRLVEAGFKVVCLEQGHWQDKSQYRGSEWDAELASTSRFSSLSSLRRSKDDYPIDNSESDMVQLNFCGVGGSTILYNAVWIRFMEEHFRTRTLCGEGADWPLSYEDLRPFYERTDIEIGVSGLEGNPAYPEGAGPPLPPFPIGEGGLAVARAMAKRGLHWWPDTNAIVTAPYDGRYACVQRGSCPSGCNEGAKSSVDLTHWKKVVAAGGQLITAARVRRIILDDNGLAAGAEWVDESGEVYHQSADIVLIACNGIGTPRLLLNSTTPEAPQGIANSSGLVGRGLMLHPIAIVAGVFDLPLNAWQGHNGSILHSLEFGTDKPERGFRLGAKWALHPSSVGPIQEGYSCLLRGGSPESHHARFNERFGQTLHWSIMCEDLPRDENRVVLSDHLTDSSGMPAAKIEYRYDENTRKSLDFNVEQAATIFREAGAKIVDIRNPSGSNAHFMGTARMGDNSKTSVVNRWCMSHDIPNLGIIDGSVFPSSSPVNPTSTICALALRTAEYLIEKKRELPVPKPIAAPEPMAIAPGAAPALAISPGKGEASSLTPEQISQLAMLAGALIPPSEGLPSGFDILTSGKQQARILEIRPDLLAPVIDGLSFLNFDQSSLLEQSSELSKKYPSVYQSLLYFICACYYSDLEVMKIIGYQGRVANTVTPDRYPPYFEEGLLDHLIS